MEKKKRKLEPGKRGRNSHCTSVSPAHSSTITGLCQFRVALYIILDSKSVTVFKRCGTDPLMACVHIQTVHAPVNSLMYFCIITKCLSHNVLITYLHLKLQLTPQNGRRHILPHPEPEPEPGPCPQKTHTLIFRSTGRRVDVDGR